MASSDAAMEEEAVAAAAEKTPVLYLNHVSEMSGAEQSLYALLRQFRRARSGIEPIVALPGEGPFVELLREQSWDVSSIPIQRLERPQSLRDGIDSLRYILRVVPQVARLGRESRAQIIHSNSTTAHLVGGPAARRLGVPAVWHVRDLVSLQPVAPLLSACATAVIAISHAVAQKLAAEGVPQEKIHMIYNGLDPELWRAPAEQKKRELQSALGFVETATFLFGCVGQLVPWKNHAAFIEAAALLAQEEGCAHARFVIMGGDLWSEQSSYVRKLRALVKERGLQERFKFLPHQSDAVAALSALDCVVLASREEPFGRVLIEGMSLSKPVIAYNKSGPAEIVTHEKDGLLASASEEASSLALMMKRVLLEPELRAELAGAARATVTERFHIAESAQKVKGVYRSIRD